MLVLKKVLQLVNLPHYIKFGKLRYSQFEVISRLLIEKFNVKELLKDYLTILIQAIKSIDKGVIEVEILEQWHRLKLHRMLLMYYLETRKMELLC